MRQRPGRVLGYVRVSGAEQGRSGTSLDAQEDAIARFCAANGYPPPRIYKEVESAGEEKQEKRVELHALLREVRPNDQIVVASVDRFSRDLVYGVGTVRALVRQGIGWFSLNDAIDAETEEGDSRLGIMSWVADRERRDIYRRTVGTRKALTDQGFYVHGEVPIGYRVEHRRLVIDPVQAAWVRLIYELCIRGKSLEDIVAHMSSAHPERRWHGPTVHRILLNRIYCGDMHDSAGNWITNNHPAIITRTVWEQAQEALKSRQKGGRKPLEDSRTWNWLMRGGLASCALCGRTMGAVYARKTGVYYACWSRIRDKTCTAKYVPVASADEAVAELALERLKEIRHELAKPPPAEPKRPRTNHAAHIARIKQQRERAIDLATDGAITKVDLKRKLDQLDAAIRKLELEAEAVERADRMRAPESRAEALADVGHLERLWARGTPPQRREVLRELARTIRIEAGRPPLVDWKSIEELTGR